jgi:hypothetical protein
MEYLTDLVTTVPEGTSPAKVDELRSAEAVRAAEPRQSRPFGASLASAARSRRMAQHCTVPRRRRGRASRSPRLITPSYLDAGHHYAADSASQ